MALALALPNVDKSFILYIEERKGVARGVLCARTGARTLEKICCLFVKEIGLSSQQLAYVLKGHCHSHPASKICGQDIPRTETNHHIPTWARKHNQAAT